MATPERDGFAFVLAAYTATAVAMSHQHDDLDRREAALHRALSTRDVIGQAKGTLTERRHLSAGEAVDVLRRASQRLNQKLVDEAERFAETGKCPPSADRASGPPWRADRPPPGPG
jgi:AmiR/NasT family two-component response regulator